MTYGIYTLSQTIGRVGTLHLRRSVKAGGEVQMKADFEKLLDAQCREKINGEVFYAANDLFSPIRWNFSSRIVDRRDTAMKVTVMKRSAVVKNGEVEISDVSGTRRIPVQKPFTFNWGIFDALQRRSKDEGELNFTLVDYFEQFKPNHVLSYRKSVSVLFDGKQGIKKVVDSDQKQADTGQQKDGTYGTVVRLHGFDHIGSGVIPWVYWLDEHGHLLFAVSGLQAYVFESIA